MTYAVIFANLIVLTVLLFMIKSFLPLLVFVPLALMFLTIYGFEHAAKNAKPVKKKEEK